MMRSEKYHKGKEQLKLMLYFYGGGSNMAICESANGNGSLSFIADVSADGGSGMNSEVYMDILSAVCQMLQKMIRWRFRIQMHTDPRHALKAAYD